MPKIARQVPVDGPDQPCYKLSRMDADFRHLMREALLEAEKAFREGEVPVGAVLSDEDGKILARAHNMPISLCDPTAHAEILVLRTAASHLGNYRLTKSTLVVTIEPCLMCMGAALNARIGRLVFGAPDPKSGAAGSLYRLGDDSRLNHRIEVLSGVMESECTGLMQAFFRARRAGNDKAGEVPKWS
jgi:tRNA(adenine34) deaminase